MKKIPLLIGFLLSMLSIKAQSLNSIEQKLMEQTEKNYPQMMELLKASVNINSGTFNIKGVQAVGEMYAKELKALGFTIEFIQLPDSLKRV